MVLVDNSYGPGGPGMVLAGVLALREERGRAGDGLTDTASGRRGSQLPGRPKVSHTSFQEAFNRMKVFKHMLLKTTF